MNSNGDCNRDDGFPPRGDVSALIEGSSELGALTRLSLSSVRARHGSHTGAQPRRDLPDRSPGPGRSGCRQLSAFLRPHLGRPDAKQRWLIDAVDGRAVCAMFPRLYARTLPRVRTRFEERLPVPLHTGAAAARARPVGQDVEPKTGRRPHRSLHPPSSPSMLPATFRLPSTDGRLGTRAREFV